MAEPKHVTIYTDGACVGNPGPGGYGLLLRHGGQTQELSGGFSPTTNNRMELLAAIVGLEALKERCQVTVYSDSSYLVNAVSKGWVQRWKKQGWKRNKKGELASNPDLWERLLGLLEQHDVRFEWVRGHAGDPDNERVDRLAVGASRQRNLPRDPGYPPQRARE